MILDSSFFPTRAGPRHPPGCFGCPGEKVARKGDQPMFSWSDILELPDLSWTKWFARIGLPPGFHASVAARIDHH